MNHSYYRSKIQAERVAKQVGGSVVSGPHPFVEDYGSVLVWWVVL